jgi:GT2 family glycosyltransferase
MSRKLSIIIVNWHSKDFVKKCLVALDRHTTLNRQTIVVDGASFDGCGEMVADGFPHVEFIQSEVNHGFGNSNNFGASKAEGEFILLLNPDTEIHAGALESMLNVIESDQSVGLVGAKLLNSDGSIQTSCVQAFPTPVNRALDSNFLRKLLPKSVMWGSLQAFCAQSPTAVDAVSGACMLIRRDTFQRIGGFPSDYFMYGEDIHLCWILGKEGKKIVFDPNALVTHHGGGASGGDFGARSALEMRRSVYRFIRHRQGGGAGILYRVLMGFSATVRMGLLASSLVLTPKSRRKRIIDSIQVWYVTFCWAIRAV